MEVPIQEIPKSDSERKGKLTSLYNSGKYKIMASFYNLVRSMPSELPPLSDSSIYLCGQCYQDTEAPEDCAKKREYKLRKSTDSDLPTHVQNFLSHFNSLLWFCYRKDFPPLEPSQLTTDIGWGCMLRTGPQWRLSEEDQLQPYSTYRQSSPYSIHHLVWRSKVIDLQSGINITKVGEWFTPTRVSQILKYLIRRHSPDRLTMYLSKDGVIYRDRVKALCTSALYNAKSPRESFAMDSEERKLFNEANDQVQEGETPWRPVFIVVPVRLGVQNLNPLYIPSLKCLLQMPQSVGVMGGKPRQSLYFVGFQDDFVFYLDPHIVRPSVRGEFDDFQKMLFENVDPSLAAGFYCSNETEFEDLCQRIQQLPDQNPIISIGPAQPDYLKDNSEEDIEENLVFV